MSDPKRRGRPPLVEGDTTTPVTVRFTNAMYDRVTKAATDKRVNVSEVIRQAVTVGFRTLK